MRVTAAQCYRHTKPLNKQMRWSQHRHINTLKTFQHAATASAEVVIGVGDGIHNEDDVLLLRLAGPVLTEGSGVVYALAH